MTMIFENFYVGNTAYYIRYQNGTHEILTTDTPEGEPAVIFTGSYEECIKRKKEMQAEYQDSLF